MKSIAKYLLALVAMVCLPLQAQEVNTLYFLHNAPMRHIINPAFQPQNNVYIVLPAIGYTTMSMGNNALTMKDLIFQDPTTGKTITALHPNAEGQLWNKLPSIMNINTNLQVNLLSFGAQVAKGKGYFHVNLSERIGLGIDLPKSMFGPLLGQSLNNINLNSLNIGAMMYTEAALGYSHIINEHWTVGAKVKILAGHAYARGHFSELGLNSSQESTILRGNGTIQVAGLVDTQMLQSLLDGTGLPSNYFPDQVIQNVKPAGYGGALDMGVSYKPFKFMEVNAAVTDLGFIYWQKGGSSIISMDTTFNGLGDLKYEDYTDQNGNFQTDAFMSDLTENMGEYLNALHIHNPTNKPFTNMLTANLRVGVDFSVWKERIAVGIHSRTQFYNNQQVAEELIVGAAFRPFKSLNIAASYSLLNGHLSNFGGALSISPGGGIMLTLAADYIPTNFAAYQLEDMEILLPYETGRFNFAMGLAVIIGKRKPKVSNTISGATSTKPEKE